MTEIEHMGKETILPPGGGQPMVFEHDAVVLQFQFNATGLKTIADCTGDRIFSHQEIENDYQYRSGESTMSTNAPISPFATWRFQVLGAENEGLVMTGVTEIIVEICGRNMSSL
ncbi:hypothetical protein BKA60DRAFT_587382 [Fusarium oxysporum]|uniref:Uncharacterized protein n=1 Tax=Fusarium oxysporum TaxID=5507 RepID=A0A420MCK8_FUSOX|nr:hypothetical protein BKA60DRAFT_587382 [Fusarium oxysporum]RKK65790.1 hypothetical protein BFJ69_g15970 [Fusarium oxysporum]